MGVTNIISLLSGIALFLFGMSLMGDRLKQVAGNKLEIFLYRLSNTPLKGILLGTGVTAIIQSSSATSVMVVGFVNSGMMKLKQAISVIMGSILGTSITGWIISLSYVGGSSGWLSLLSTSTITGVIAVIGIILRMFSKKQLRIHVGDILLGFAVLMFGMQAMSTAVSPLRDSEEFLSLLTAFSNPFLGIVVGAVFTSILQSASAAVGILQALAMTGAISFSAAFPIIMGISIGASVPVLISSLGANADAKRSAFAYLFITLLGAIIIGILFYVMEAVFHFSFMADTVKVNAFSVAFVNSLYRFVNIIVLTPLIGAMEKLSIRLFREKDDKPKELTELDRLDERFVAHPALAIEQSREVINLMAMRAQDNLIDAFELVKRYSEDAYNVIQEKESIVDTYEDRLGSYLVKVTRGELNKRQNEDISKFLHTIGDFERISDHAVNVSECAKEIYEKKVIFSPDGQREVDTMCTAVGEIVSIAVGAFVNNDLELAARVEPLEELIDDLCDEMKLHHIDRLQKGQCSLEQGFVFNDLLTNFERAADHCSNIAVAMIELESDAFDTHEYLKSVKEMKNESFEKYYEEYKKKFAF